MKSNIYQIDRNDLVVVMLVGVDGGVYLVAATIDLGKNGVMGVSYRKL
jgi:hypothetical protein